MHPFGKTFAAGTLFAAAADLNFVQRAARAALVELAASYVAFYALVDVFHKITSLRGGKPPVLCI